MVIAKRSGIRGFTAEVLRDNRKMQAVFNHCGLTYAASWRMMSTASRWISEPWAGIFWTRAIFLIS